MQPDDIVSDSVQAASAAVFSGNGPYVYAISAPNGSPAKVTS